MGERVAVAVDGQALARWPLSGLACAERWAGATGSVVWGMWGSVKVSSANDAETGPDPRNGGGERLRIAGIAGKHLDRNRAALPVGEQPVLDLPTAALAITAVPGRGQLAARAFHP